MHGGDEPVLDLLTPEPAPARAFEVVAVRGLREAALHQVTTTTSIRLCFGEPGKRERDFQFSLLPVSGHRPTGFAASTFGPQQTRRADFFVGDIVRHLSTSMEATRFQALPDGTNMNVVRLVVTEVIFGEEPVAFVPVRANGTDGPKGVRLRILIFRSARAEAVISPRGLE